jgi:hypothetical protein
VKAVSFSHNQPKFEVEYLKYFVKRTLNKINKNVWSLALAEGYWLEGSEKRTG